MGKGFAMIMIMSMMVIFWAVLMSMSSMFCNTILKRSKWLLSAFLNMHIMHCMVMIKVAMLGMVMFILNYAVTMSPYQIKRLTKI